MAAALLGCAAAVAFVRPAGDVSAGPSRASGVALVAAPAPFPGLDSLRGMGIQADRLRVMSGFRTPQYNALGVGAGGRASDSRHQYGDAADVYVVNGARDWMSDLNGDGRVDTRDARVLASAVEQVERKYPELTGGVGIYQATDAHGPFVHIDVRGKRARWGVL